LTGFWDDRAAVHHGRLQAATGLPDSTVGVGAKVPLVIGHVISATGRATSVAPGRSGWRASCTPELIPDSSSSLIYGTSVLWDLSGATKAFYSEFYAYHLSDP
jgi:hypothetical protein